MDITTTNRRILSLDTLLIVKQGSVSVKHLDEIPDINDNQTAWVLFDKCVHDSYTKTPDPGAIVVVDHIRKPRVDFPLDVYIDFGYDKAKEEYSDILECDIKDVVCIGKMVKVNGGYKISIDPGVDISNFIKKPEPEYINIKIKADNLIYHAKTIITQSGDDIIKEDLTTIPTITDDKKMYLIGLSTGGVMEDPEIRVEKPYSIVVANNDEDALIMYNKAHKCSYFYGTCVGELTY